MRERGKVQGTEGVSECTAVVGAEIDPEIAVNATRFILVRHAESTWNAAGRWQGHGDPRLSARGRSQALQCAERMAGMTADLLVCSDLLRTRETAEAIGRTLGLQPAPCSSLRELAIGEWTGLTRSEIEARDHALLQRFETDDPNIRPGGGETRAEIRIRVREKVESLAHEHPGSRIVMVVHAGVIRALIPDSEPGNTEIVEVTLSEIRASRRDLGSGAGEIL
jgi:probable phosphoglycerate mutase